MITLTVHILFCSKSEQDVSFSRFWFYVGLQIHFRLFLTLSKSEPLCIMPNDLMSQNKQGFSFKENVLVTHNCFQGKLFAGIWYTESYIIAFDLFICFHHYWNYLHHYQNNFHHYWNYLHHYRNNFHHYWNHLHQLMKNFLHQRPFSSSTEGFF